MAKPSRVQAKIKRQLDTQEAALEGLQRQLKQVLKKLDALIELVEQGQAEPEPEGEGEGE